MYNDVASGAVSPHTGGLAQEWRPQEASELPVDVYVEDDKLYIISTIAGISPEDIDIAVENGTVVIKGERLKPYSGKDDLMLKEECIWGSFYKELIINEKFDVDAIVANIDRGLLILTLPIID